jgi:hypothetical protein
MLYRYFTLTGTVSYYFILYLLRNTTTYYVIVLLTQHLEHILLTELWTGIP